MIKKIQVRYLKNKSMLLKKIIDLSIKFRLNKRKLANANKI